MQFEDRTAVTALIFMFWQHWQTTNMGCSSSSSILFLENRLEILFKLYPYAENEMSSHIFMEKEKKKKDQKITATYNQTEE